MIEDVPLPSVDDPIDAPFWQAALAGELVVQACASCGKRRFPPRAMCPHCQSPGRRWEKVSGRGRIWSFAVPHPPLLPAFTRLAPYVVAVVELEEDPQIRMVGNLVRSAGGEINEVDPAGVVIGAPVRAVFPKIAEDTAFPRWMLV